MSQEFPEIAAASKNFAKVDNLMLNLLKSTVVLTKQ